MSKAYISIQEASELARKSIQTIRRAIKAKKILTRRRKTPQGFNYLIEKESFSNFYNLGLTKEIPQENIFAESVNEPKAKSSGKKIAVEPEDFKNFVKTLESLLNQHSEERQNFLRLINTLQEKVFVLENQLNLLKAPMPKRWYQLFRK